MTRSTYIGRGRLRARRALLCLTTILASCGAGATAFAQDAKPYRQIDENGIDLSSGDVIMAFKEASVGSGPAELAIVRRNGSDRNSSQFDELAFQRTQNGNVTVVVSNRDRTYDAFDKVGNGPFVARKRNGVMLTGGGNDYSYTAADGTVTRFGAPIGGPGDSTSLCDSNPSQYSCALVPVSITSPNGAVVTLSYDAGGYPVYSDPLPNPPPMAFYWRLRRVSNSYGYAFEYSYASDTTDPDAPPPDTWFVRTGATFLNSGNTVSSVGYAYPFSGYTDVTDPTGATWRVSDTTLRRPGETSNSYVANASSASALTVTRDGIVTSYARTVGGTTATMTVTNALSQTSTIVSDLTTGRPTAITDAASKTTTYGYDSYGRLTRVTSPEQNYVAYTLDARGNTTETRVVGKTGPSVDDIVTTAVYPAACGNPMTCNQPDSTTDALMQTTNYTYDATHGGITKVERPAPSPGAPRPTVNYGYTQVAGEYRLTSASTCTTAATCAGTANEIVSTATYDTAGNLTGTTTGAGNPGGVSATATYGYTATGDLSSIDGPLAGSGDTTQYLHDAARRPTGVIAPDPDGSGPRLRSATIVDRAADGAVVLTKVGTVPGAGASGFVESYHAFNHYDANRRIDRRTLWAAGTDYAVQDTLYDALGRPSCQIVRMDPGAWGLQATSCAPLQTTGPMGPDRVSSTSYDMVGRVSGTTGGIGTPAQSTDANATFTDNGRVQTLTDGNGNRTSYAYDKFDRLKRTSYPVTTVGANTSSTSDYEELGYDANGRVTSRRLRDGNAILFGYDLAGRIQHKSPGGVRGVAYRYDLLDRMTEAAYDALGGPDAVTLSYDALGRVVSSTTGMGGTSRTMDYAHDLAGNVTGVTQPGGVSFAMSYDPLNRMTFASWTAPGVGTVPFFGIGYDDLGRRTSTGRASSVTGYGYDAVSRLSGVTQQFAGSIGNDSATLGYNPASQIASTSHANDAFAYTAHANANTAEVPDGLNRVTSVGGAGVTYDARGNVTSDGTTGYGYDPENRLTSASAGGGTTLTYDPLGRLWEVSNAAYGRTQFVYDREQVAVEYDGVTGAVRRRFFWGPGSDEPVLQDEGGAMNCTGTRVLHGDERGSIVAAADCNGTRQAVNAYDEYGNATAGNWGRYQYTGQAWLPEVGLYYYKNRMYAPKLGRFMQADPIGYDAGMNLYGYVGGDPVNFVDPSGLRQQQFCQPAVYNTTNSAGDYVVIGYRQCSYFEIPDQLDFLNFDTPRRGGRGSGSSAPASTAPQNPKPCSAPLDTNIGSARAVLEAAALGADIATVGLAAGGVTGPAAIGTKALGYLFEAGIGAVNAYDAYANGNYGPLEAQGASLGARLIPGGRAFQSGLKAVRGPTGILRNSAGRFRSSYLNNPAVKEAGDLATQKTVGGAAGAVVCPNG